MFCVSFLHTFCDCFLLERSSSFESVLFVLLYPGDSDFGDFLFIDVSFVLFAEFFFVVKSLLRR